MEKFEKKRLMECSKFSFQPNCTKYVQMALKPFEHICKLNNDKQSEFDFSLIIIWVHTLKVSQVS